MQYGVYPLLSEEECDEIVALLNTCEWQTGKARTEELTGSIKQNLELKPQNDGDMVKQMSGRVMKALAQNKDIALDTLVKSMMPLKFNKYDQNTEPAGGAYHRHTDAPWMGPVRTDFTIVVSLSDPDEYEGGEHHVVDPHMGEMVFKTKKGEAMLYETGYPHWVTNVTKGTKIGGLTWFESQVDDCRKRALLKTCRSISLDMESRMDPNDPECPFRQWFVDAGVIHSGLYRMWAQR